MRSTWIGGLMLLLFGAIGAMAEDKPVALEKGVRGLVVRATEPVVVDGKLREWSGAYCTPVHYSHGNLTNRAAQFFYLWDEQALYVGLRTLDEKPANIGNPGSLWNGDAVEFYFDARTGDSLRGQEWSTGAIHLFYTAFEKATVHPRWTVRQGIATSDVRLKGVEIGATSEGGITELEFKLPWANFPEFTPKAGSVIALDAELCSGDGEGRTDRTFAYGSPLSVQQPASLGKVELVNSFDPAYLPEAGPSTFPMWVETPWTQSERARVRAVVAIPPSFVEQVGAVNVRLHDADGKVVRTEIATIEPFGPPGAGFVRAVASWSIDDYAPNTYFATARVESKDGKTLTSVAPRMVQEAQMSGR
ncbi:sugar-binding protein [Tundrisphaera lichenicola]|uniref:sugar-binding protein n=1 Tax=Tundrisphaera lichenicola TaxID=2029860 RepID=UPI003EBBEAB7